MTTAVPEEPFDPLIEDEATELSYADIYGQVVANDELIVTVAADQVDALRIGLTRHKAKQNAKLKSAGLQPDNASLSFETTPSKEHKGAMDVHIVLAKRTQVTILGMKKPDPTF